MAGLAEAPRKHGDISLLIVDSIADVVSGDSHKNSEARRGLRPLVDFAETLKCAVLGIAHFNKGSAGKDPLERVMGSAAFGAVARTVFACAKLVEKMSSCAASSAVRRATSARTTAGRIPAAEHHHRGGIDASCAVFGAAIEGTAKEILASPDDTGGSSTGKGKIADAEHFLREILKDGAVASNRIKKEGKEQYDLSWLTLRRAQENLMVSARQIAKQGWFWEMPVWWKAEERNV